MEGQEYLNQLAKETRPVKPKKGGFLSSKWFIGGMIALVVLIFIMMLGSMLSNNKGGEKNLGVALKLHLDNTTSIIDSFQTSVKSSDLRSSSASLYGILTNTSRDLTNYLADKYKMKFKEKELDKDIVAEANLQRDGLYSELFEAKINGILDRIYAHKMAYEISVLLSEESKLMETSKNETLDGLLKTSYDSLENLYTKFNDFSEAKTRKE